MTGKREAALRTPVRSGPAPVTEALSRVAAELQDPTPAELARPTFPPRMMNPKAPGFRPKKVAIEFETVRTSKRWPFVVAAAGSLALALGALGMTLHLSDLTGAAPPHPSADQPRTTLTGAVARLPEERPKPTSSPGLQEQAQERPSDLPISPASGMSAPAQVITERPLPAAEATDQGGELRAALEAPASPTSPESEPASPKPDPATLSDHGQLRTALTLVGAPPPVQNSGTATRVAALGDIKVVPPPLGSSAPDSQGERLMKRALDMIQQGDISGARLILERAVSSGSAQAAFHLAQTYDPRILAKWQARGIKGDAPRARELYRMASEAGVLEAQEHIANLE